MTELCEEGSASAGSLFDQRLEFGVDGSRTHKERSIEALDRQLAGLGRVAPGDFDSELGGSAGVALHIDTGRVGFLDQRGVFLRANVGKDLRGAGRH